MYEKSMNGRWWEQIGETENAYDDDKFDIHNDEQRGRGQKSRGPLKMSREIA